jgi:hypothetical protein
VPQFIPGLELNRRFSGEVVRPLIAARFPGLPYSAALIGYGSDVLGYDTATSCDHEWGPRLLLFLDTERFESDHDAIDAALRAELPPVFLGYSTAYTRPKPGGGWVRSLTKAVPGAIAHHIEITALDAFFRRELGIAADAGISTRDWLTFPEQKLLELTAGAVYHDGLGALIPLRERLAYYPHEVWLLRMAAQWRRIAEEEAFVGRCGEVGDDLGSRSVAARLARDLMRLCFLQERRYAPYSKWLGTAFQRLGCASDVGPALAEALSASEWEARERALGVAYVAVARAHNALALTSPLDPAPRSYYDRPFQVIFAERFAAALVDAIRDPEARRLAAATDLAGAVDQFSDSVSILQHPPRFRRLSDLLAGEG